MSAAKWVTQCVSTEISTYRRASLNQLEILNQLCKLPSQQILQSKCGASSFKSETDLTKCTDRKVRDVLKTPKQPSLGSLWVGALEFPSDSVCSNGEYPALRRASCGPLLPGFLPQTPTQM